MKKTTITEEKIPNNVEKKKKIITYLKSIFSVFLFLFSSYFSLIPIFLFNIDTEKMSNEMSILLSMFSSIMLVLVFFILYYQDLKREWKIFKDNRLKNIDVGFKYWTIGLFFMIASNLLIQLFTSNGIANNEQAVQSMIEISPWIMLISAGILAPITEEITFRKAFKDSIKNPIIFVLVSGIIFGALHVISATTLSELLYIIPYSSLGIAFAYMYHKTDTVFTPMLMHFIHNTALTLISILPLL